MKYIYLLIALLISIKCSAQQTVQWTYSTKKIQKNIYEIHLTAMVQNPWHIYSQYMDSGGPLPTTITLNHNPNIELIGTIKEKGKLVTEHVKVFDMDVKYYTDSVDFVQKLKLKDGAHAPISGTIEYMLCEADHCTPPIKRAFEIDLK
ncbi:protein-disulfide reductase DsbD domain-containing protein [Mucilaginibacter flavidus]|uniref:protein-disulfide reductase DsbD domain-containing protein n=1 Tax=Mucilaginibacter flavidus TaxID=2949309 RepID=UPI002092988C|nr:protein-disulfide reductase DsbD domain-containing protein [Mucilaginibacter flavidus]MCO5947933.1 sugar transporter [Mucilaginibacter flavidus]